MMGNYYSDKLSKVSTKSSICIETLELVDQETNHDE